MRILPRTLICIALATVCAKRGKTSRAKPRNEAQLSGSANKDNARLPELPGVTNKDEAQLPGLRILTYSVDIRGQPSVSFLEQSFCRTSANTSACPIVNLALFDRLHRRTFRRNILLTKKMAALHRYIEFLDPKVVVLFLDSIDVFFVGCGAGNSPVRPPPMSTQELLRNRILDILDRSKATVIFGAEFGEFDMPYALPDPPQHAFDMCRARVDPASVRDFTSCASWGHCSSASRPLLKFANTGIVAGRAGDLLRVTDPIAVVRNKTLSGKTDQGKYISFFLQPHSHPDGAMTLDYCSELALNVMVVTNISFTMDRDARRVSFPSPWDVGPDLCFMHWNGPSKKYKSFVDIIDTVVPGGCSQNKPFYLRHC